MIGVFDSGSGGLTILHGLVETLPEYDYVYLGDHARAPYGHRTPEDILQCTKEGVEMLFRKGAPLVILACNTASVWALRRLQQEWLPKHFPKNRLLGIVVPTIEQITETTWSEEGVHEQHTDRTSAIGVFATERTVASGVYTKEIHKRHPDLLVFEEVCPDVVRLVEEGADETLLRTAVTPPVHALLQRVQASDKRLTAVLLGCTHFALVASLFRALLPSTMHVYEQPTLVAESLVQYLLRHPEITACITRGGTQTFYTTGNPVHVSQTSTRFFSQQCRFQNLA